MRYGKLRRVVSLWALALALAACSVVAGSQQAQEVGPDATPAGSAPTAASPSPQPAPPTPEPPTPAQMPAPAAPPRGLVVVGSEQGQSLKLVDAATNAIARTVQLGAPAHGVAISPDGQTAWVFSGRWGDSEFRLVDLARGAQQGSKRLADSPYSVAFSSDGVRAFVSLYAGNAVSFLKATSRDEFGRIKLGRQSDGAQLRRRPASVAVLPGTGGDVLYVAGQGSGVVWALDAGSGKQLAEIEVGGGPMLVLTDPAHSTVYALVDTLDQLVAIDPAGQRVVRRLALPGRASSAALAPSGAIYVTGVDAGEVWVVEPGARSISSRIPVGSRPSGVAFSADGGRAYVTNRADGSLSVIDAPTRRVLDTVEVGQDPAAVAFSPFSGKPPSPTPTAPRPTPTPTIVPTPTPLPPGAKPPDHLPAGAVKETFVPGAAFPVAMAFAPDGRLFYNELRTGKIRVVQNGVLLPEPFYEFAVAGEPETGLLGLTLDPDFARNHYVYVFYTSVAGGGKQSGGANGPNQVVRLTDVNGKGTNLTPILRDLPSGPVHNAGTLRFGPDGKLYVSLGDNEDGPNAQDLGSQAGKILRVNPDGSIPDDNPFVGQRGKRPSVWAYGLRNPFSFDFQPVNHALYATENGPGDNDELNLIVKGGNYGWPPAGFQDKPGVVDPLEVINPPIGPTALAFYRGDQFPEWKNELFYCNYHRGELRRVHLAPESFDRIVFDEVVTTGCSLDVVSGPDGALYYSDENGIYRIRQSSSRGLLAPVSTASPAVTPTATARGAASASDRDVGVTMTEWKLTLSRAKLPAGKIRFLAENLGAVDHALRVSGAGGGKKVDVQTRAVKPGQAATLEVDLPPGSYTLTCPIPGHAEHGMTATITVVAQ